jgi:hypothetical protein
VAGALYAQGILPDDILRIFLTTRLFKFIRPSTSLKGFFRADRLETLCRQYLPARFVRRTGVAPHRQRHLTSGGRNGVLLGRAAHPAAAGVGGHPVLFEPVQIGGRLLVDGGLLNNLPVEPLLGRCDFIIGVHTNPCAPGRPLRNVRNIMEADRCCWRSTTTCRNGPGSATCTWSRPPSPSTPPPTTPGPAKFRHRLRLHAGKRPPHRRNVCAPLGSVQSELVSFRVGEFESVGPTLSPSASLLAHKLLTLAQVL